MERGYLRSGLGFIVLGEEGDGETLLACSSCSSNTVDIVLDGESDEVRI